MEKYGWIVDEELYYKLRQEKQKYALSELSISDLLISNGKRTLLYYEILRGFRTEDKEVLKIACVWKGFTVAHIQVRKGWRTEDKEVLKIANEEGWTVAHEQASHGWTTEDKEILKLADKNGWTVAHEQARNGWITTDPEVLALEDKKGITVFQKILDYYNHLAFYKDEELDKNFNLLLTVIDIGKQLQLQEKNWANLFEYLEEKSKKLINQVFRKKIEARK